MKMISKSKLRYVQENTIPTVTTTPKKRNKQLKNIPKQHYLTASVYTWLSFHVSV